MFPLSDQFEREALLAAYFAFCAFFSVLAFWRFRFAIFPLLVYLSLAIYFIWFWRQDLAHDSYH